MSTASYRPQYEKSHALVIGINSYTDTRFVTLGQAEADAQAVADLLASPRYGFKVHTLLGEDASKQAILESLFELRATNPDDRILVYFAGHGYTLIDKFDHETGYVAAADTVPERDFTALSLDEITDLRRHADAKHIAFIFDACFSGKALGLTKTTTVTAAQFLLRRAFQVISAGAADQTVSDFDSMTALLLEELQSEEVEETTGLFTLSNLGLHVRDRMAGESGQTQIPQFGHLRGSQGGDFVFRIAGPAARLPRWILDAVRSADSAERLMAVDRLHRLTQDDSALAELALKEIERMSDDDSSMVAAAARAALKDAQQAVPLKPVEELHPGHALKQSTLKSSFPTRLWIYGRLVVVVLLLVGFFGPWAQISGCTVVGQEQPPMTLTGLGVLTSLIGTPFVAPILLLFVFALLYLGINRLRRSGTLAWMERIAAVASVANMALLLFTYTGAKVLWGFWVTFVGVLLAPINLVGELRSGYSRHEKPSGFGRFLIGLVAIAASLIWVMFIVQTIADAVTKNP